MDRQLRSCGAACAKMLHPPNLSVAGWSKRSPAHRMALRSCARCAASGSPPGFPGEQSSGSVDRVGALAGVQNHRSGKSRHLPALEKVLHNTSRHHRIPGPIQRGLIRPRDHKWSANADPPQIALRTCLRSGFGCSFLLR